MKENSNQLPLPGDLLHELCAQTAAELVLVAPFAKVGTVERLLAVLPPSASLRMVTRWRVEEIVAGVSDLEVWPLLQSRSGCQLFLHPFLHAKYFRGDGQCLVGSANLTAAALGWSEPRNLELLVPLAASQLALAEFERDVFRASVPVTDELYLQMRDLVDALGPVKPPHVVAAEVVKERPDVAYVVDPMPGRDEWVPQLRNPEDLYTAYSGQAELLPGTSREAAYSDLALLSVPPGLSKAAFELSVAGLLLQMPIVLEVDRLVTTPQRFGAVRDLLERLPCAHRKGFSADRAWQTLMRWLRHFLPKRYGLAIPNHSEVFFRLPRTADT